MVPAPRPEAGANRATATCWTWRARLLALALVVLLATGFALTGPLSSAGAPVSRLKSRSLIAPGTFALAGDEAGCGRLEHITIERQPFCQALRLTTLRRPARAYGLQIVSPTSSPVAAGSAVRATFYLRCPESSTHGARTTLVFEEVGGSWSHEVSWPAAAQSDWCRVDVPFITQRGWPPGGAQLCFRMGYDPQVLEIGGVELVDYGPGVSLSALDGTFRTYAGREPGAAWRQTAESAIDAHRKADVKVRVLDRSRKPVGGARVSVEMRHHAFGFGTAVRASLICPATPSADSERYRHLLVELFDQAVLENEMKWARWEGPDRQQASRAVSWLRRSGLGVRGHTLVWPSWLNLPGDMRSLASDPESLRRRVRDHVAQEVRAFRGQVVDWDVLNEPFTCGDLAQVLGPDEASEWFKIARQEDPSARLFVNDFDIIERGGLDREHQQFIEELIARLVERGAPVDALGLQGHFDWNLTPPERLIQLFDRFARPVAGRGGLTVTELDIAVTDEELQADYLRDVLTVAFAHPAVTGVLLWGFWAGQHVHPEAALFRGDWSERRAACVWRDLVRKRWWTRAAGQTDVNGSFRVRAFLGDHEATVTAGRESRTVPIQLDGKGKIVEVVLE